ncbi:hypothetical protein MIND_00195800 [Mycena indigotica]|uniref:Uncharacterized protein n=1 Tax=Mycena indigotica TaxID=2126181 RepID=A0A8H6WCW4_9AGAR|nr:uncharacterized protein MIND_00195800 [Mycena indigotica]KAF7311851.1 hypothetical protein MIND_00195800 [Mycena indigotica]
MDRRLPPELEREVFETAALLHRGTIPHMLRVARRVLVWIEPYLYHDLELGMVVSKDANRLLQVILAKDDAFPAHAVRSVVLGAYFADQLPALPAAVRSALTRMTGVVRLAIAGIWGDHSAEIFSLVADMPLQRLACYMEDLLGPAALMHTAPRHTRRPPHLSPPDPLPRLRRRRGLRALWHRPRGPHTAPGANPLDADLPPGSRGG